MHLKLSFRIINMKALIHWSFFAFLNVENMLKNGFQVQMLGNKTKQTVQFKMPG